MNNENAKETKNIVLAFFDILGISKLLNNGSYQKVYDFYLEMVKLCSDARIPIAIQNPLYMKESLFSGLDDAMVNLADFDTPFHIIDYELHHAFFSDTFILWIEENGFFRHTLAGFLEKCCIVFCKAIQKGIPLRGVISTGSAIMDKDQRIYLGKPLVEAAKAEPQQNWLGIGLGQSIRTIHQMDMEYLLPYYNHIKAKGDRKECLLNDWVLDWPSWWRHQYQDDMKALIKQMDVDERFRDYYYNCLSFVEVTKQREIIWRVFMLFCDLHQLGYLSSLGDNLNAEQKALKTKLIETMLSPKTKDFIYVVLNMDASLWLDKKSHSILLNLQNGIIMV